MYIDDEGYFEHHGVKGQRWGIENHQRKSRAELRSLDKKTKKRDNARDNREIDAARARYKTSARSNYKAAKAQYKIDKHIIGKRQAKKSLNKVKEKNFKDYQTASQTKHGKETAAAILVVSGAVLVHTLGAVAAAKM